MRKSLAKNLPSFEILDPLTWPKFLWLPITIRPAALSLAIAVSPSVASIELSRCVSNHRSVYDLRFQLRRKDEGGQRFKIATRDFVYRNRQTAARQGTALFRRTTVKLR